MLERGRQMARLVEDEVLQGLTAAQRRDLLSLLHRALDAGPPQSPWRAERATRPTSPKPSPRPVIANQNPTTARMRTTWMRPGSSSWISRILPMRLFAP